LPWPGKTNATAIYAAAPRFPWRAVSNAGPITLRFHSSPLIVSRALGTAQLAMSSDPDAKRLAVRAGSRIRSAFRSHSGWRLNGGACFFWHASGRVPVPPVSLLFEVVFEAFRTADSRFDRPQ